MPIAMNEVSVVGLKPLEIEQKIEILEKTLCELNMAICKLKDVANKININTQTVSNEPEKLKGLPDTVCGRIMGCTDTVECFGQRILDICDQL